jgi:hypothetical protein
VESGLNGPEVRAAVAIRTTIATSTMMPVTSIGVLSTRQLSPALRPTAILIHVLASLRARMRHEVRCS